MAVNLSAYDTTVGMGFNLSKTVLALKERIIQNAYDQHGYWNIGLRDGLEVKGVALLSNSSTDSSVPVFIHPLMMQSAKGDKFIFVDMRSCTKDNMDHFTITNSSEYDFIKHRLLSDLTWVIDGTEPFANLGVTPVGVYSAWISEAVSRRFALDPKDQLSLAVICSVFYQMQFLQTADEFDEYAIQKMTAVTIKATRAPAQFVFQTIDKIRYMNGIADFCEVVKEVLENTRIADFNPGILISIVSNSWFGSNAKEVLAVALEHPPTWVSVVDAAQRNRAYRNSAISKIAERYAGSKGGSDFAKQFNSLLMSKLSDEGSF